MIINISTGHELTRQETGGKAYRLWTLSCSGYNVPDGYVFLDEGFRRFCKDNDIRAGIEDMDGAIQAGAFAPDLRTALKPVFDKLSARSGAVIVRSSSVDEDGELKSFAGIYESVTGVTGFEAMLEAVKTVWRSYYSRASVQYRGHGGFLPASPVLIQEMINCDKSGVTFTQNPINQTECIITEVVRGGGQPLADGEKQAARYVESRGRLRREGGGAGFLTLQEKRGIMRLANRLTSDLGVVCDFEWGVCGGEMYVFQVRPITGRSHADVYSGVTGDDLNCVLLDRYAAPASVCYLSLLDMWQKRVYLSYHHKKKAGADDETPLNILYNRVYWNIKYQREFFEDTGSGSWFKKIKFWRLVHTGYGHWYRRLPRYVKETKRTGVQVSRTVDAKTLIRLLNEVIDNFCGFLGVDHFRYLGIAQIMYRQLKKKADNQGLEFPNLLVGSLTNQNKTMEANRELESLAELVRSDTDLKSFILENDTADISQTLSSGLTGDGGTAMERLRCEWGRFIDKHGHRGVDCDDLYYPHWREDPRPLAALLRQMASVENWEPVRADDDKKSRIRRKLRRLAKLTGQYMRLREDQRYYFDMSWELLRAIFIKLADYYIEKGVFGCRQDIFHMTVHEIREGVLYPNTVMDPSLIRRRKECFERAGENVPPYILKCSSPVEVQKSNDSASFKGTGISKGTALAPVKIIRGLNDFSSIKPGDIGVVRTFHPSWTPVLAMVSGLIMCYGNMLSHGATLAREYHIPVVVFNGDAVSVFNDGDVIQINGETGRIRRVIVS